MGSSTRWYPTGRSSDNIREFLWTQGKYRLYVEGRIQVRTYEDKNKNAVWVTEVIGDRIEFIERKTDTTAVAAPNPNARTADAFSAMGENVPFEEEIPF